LSIVCPNIIPTDLRPKPPSSETRSISLIPIIEEHINSSGPVWFLLEDWLTMVVTKWTK